MKIEINVTQEDIDAGVKCDSDKCAVALALHRAFPDAKCVGVCHGYAVVDGPGVMYRAFDLPEKVGEFIFAFDGDRHVEPFSFEIEPATLCHEAEATQEA